jgi:exosortase K
VTSRSRRDWLLFTLAVAVASILKWHYSSAAPDELAWILAPTTGAVELVTGVRFEAERGVGYLSREHYFVIEKSCAGVNFLIVAFLAAAWTVVPARRSLGGKLTALAACALGSYLAAIAANTARIAGAMALHLHVTPTVELSRERLHRIEGVAVYALCLCLFYLAARGASARRPA